MTSVLRGAAPREPPCRKASALFATI